MFKNAKVGDRVYDLRYGYGEIDEIWDTHTKPISVEFENGCNAYFHRDGRHWAEDPVPFLYWSKPEIAAPPPPKRTVKKGGWIGFFRNSAGCPIVLKGNNMVPAIYNTEGEANSLANSPNIPRAVYIEWEEEE